MKQIISSTLALTVAAFLGQAAYAAPSRDRAESAGETAKQRVVAPVTTSHGYNHGGKINNGGPMSTPSHSVTNRAPAATPSSTHSVTHQAPAVASRAPVATPSRTPALTSRTPLRQSVSPQPAPSVAVDRAHSFNNTNTARVEAQRFDQSRTSDRRDFNRHDGNWSDHGWNNYRYYNAPSTVYRDWDRGRIYSWNNHRYHWYGGSWVVVDPGYNYYADSSDDVAPIGSNVVAEVQDELSRRGYNAGPTDGLFGGQTQSAIAQFQSDRGLPVTGHIDRPLLTALGLS